MKVSIITAVYNGAEMIRDAMDSVLRQRVGVGEGVGVGGESRGQVELEYIVVDGGSTDGTVEIVREFESRIGKEARAGFSFKWMSEKDRGLYDAINKGIKMATGDVIGICNADDVLAADDVIARVAAAFTDDLDCVYGKVRFVSELGGKTTRRCFTKLWRPWMLQWGYMPPHPGVFIRRARFAEWGYYVPSRDEYKIAADYELLIRYFRVHKMRARYSGICTHVMRTGGVSTKDVGARKKLNEEIIKGNRANGYFCCWPMLLPKYAIKIWEVILPRIGLEGRQ